ncbi:P-loop containing nucleoside triphosphate hydrolase protein [Tribonema minus]|uniref:P-loop containing nucleoside triphosphate hydrolase protein n=1 Tax=Tribonema minus TaxID=303371 RepID=A0A835Z102_9STRA|nr:P-loop containing nucleoside triphosphate hydrolase protein [Tribonema minus]
MLLTSTLRVPDTAATRQALTVTQKALSALAQPSTLVAYEVLEPGWLAVPKQYGLQNFSDVDDRQTQAETVVVPPSLAVESLRAHQVKATEAVMTALTRRQEGGGCILQLPCGYGKTVTALEVARRLGVRTLIIVNTQVLEAQWKAVIAEKVPGAVVGCIKQNDFSVDGTTHVVASLKSLATRRYPVHGCGLTIVDEAHHIAACLMSRALAHCGTRWRLGLSATPERADGLSCYLQWSIGPLAYSIGRAIAQGLRVYAIELSGPSRTPVRTLNIHKGGQLVANSAGMINLLQKPSAAAEFRQALVATWIRLCVSKGRKVLVLSDRISLLKDLSGRLGTATFGFIIGAARKEEREAAAAADVICASFACAAEGLDIPSLDTLCLVTPRSGEAVITQVVGRLLRAGGRSPLVLDFVDDVRLFGGMFGKRCRVYRTLGATVTRYDHARNELRS